jgi:hypothetical protein
LEKYVEKVEVPSIYDTKQFGIANDVFVTGGGWMDTHPYPNSQGVLPPPLNQYPTPHPNYRVSLLIGPHPI